MYRLCLAVIVAFTLLTGLCVAHPENVTITDRGCVEGGAYWDYQMVRRIIIEEGLKVTYLEEFPCGSGKWYERSSSGLVGSTGGGNPGTFTPYGTVEFTVAPSEAGVITPGTGPQGRGFEWMPQTTKLVISPIVVQSLLESLQ